MLSGQALFAFDSAGPRTCRERSAFLHFEISNFNTRVHALVLLRRRLQGLFGQSFQLEARSEIGEGTTVTMRIPLRKRFEVGLLSPRAITSDLRELAPN